MTNFIGTLAMVICLLVSLGGMYLAETRCDGDNRPIKKFLTIICYFVSFGAMVLAVACGAMVWGLPVICGLETESLSEIWKYFYEITPFGHMAIGCLILGGALCSLGAILSARRADRQQGNVKKRVSGVGHAILTIGLIVLMGSCVLAIVPVTAFTFGFAFLR